MKLSFFSIPIFLLLFLTCKLSFSFNDKEKSNPELTEVEKLEAIESLLNLRLDTIKSIKHSDYALFLELAYKNIELAKSVDINWALIDVYMELGNSFIERGNYNMSLKYLNQALELAQIDEYHAYVGWVTLAIGNAYEAMFNYERAIEFFQISLNVFNSTEEQEGIALASTNIGVDFMELNDFENAEKYLSLGLNERMKLNDPVELGYVKMYIADLKIRKNKYLDAKNLLLDLIIELDSIIFNQESSYQNIAAKELMGNVWILLCECEDYLGFYDLKYKHLFEAEKLFEEMNDNVNLAVVINRISEYYYHDKQFENAILYADSAKKITSGKMILNEQAVANKTLADIYSDLNNEKLALLHFREYMLIHDSMYNQSVIDAISNVDVLVKTIEKEKDNQILTIKVASEKKIKTIVIIGAGLFVLVLLFVLLNIFRRYSNGKQLNKELMIKNDKIKNQREQLKSLNKELNFLVKSKDKFHSIIAHDLRSPVGSILSITELIANDYESYSDAEKKELINHAKETSKQTLKLLENLLDWSRVHGGHLKVKKKCFEISQEVNKTIDNLKHTAELKLIDVQVIHNGEIEVFADKEMIITVIRNLFSNAVKFTPEGKNIKVGLRKVSEMVEVWVEDEGIGIPVDKIDELLLIDSKFQQIGTNNEEGTGLGLLLSHEFVKLNDGYLNIISEENKGSRFSFYIPIYSNQ